MYGNQTSCLNYQVSVIVSKAYLNLATFTKTDSPDQRSNPQGPT